MGPDECIFGIVFDLKRMADFGLWLFIGIGLILLYEVRMKKPEKNPYDKYLPPVKKKEPECTLPKPKERTS